MRASAHASVAGGGGDAAVWLSDVRSEPPLTLRRSGARLLVVGSAAGPVGGDELDLHIRVAPHAHVGIGSAAATIVWPGPDGARSTMSLTIDVGAGAHVDWNPWPTVSVAGSDHVMSTSIRLAQGATCRVVEQLALGRGDEPSGRLDATVRIARDGTTIVHHRERFGPGVPGWGATTSIGDARFVHQEFRVGGEDHDGVGGEVATIVTGAGAAARLPLVGGAIVILAAGPDHPSVQALIAGWR